MKYKLKDYSQFLNEEIRESDIYLSFNHHEKFFSKIGNRINNRILIAQEPLHKANFSNKVFKKYTKVLSWNDLLIDGTRVEKITAQPIIKLRIDKISIENRKLMTNISMNKKSNVKGELYSERLKAIEIAEKNLQNDFEFYGVGWNKPNTIFENLNLIKYKEFKSYKGEISNKYETLRQYKFSLCFENTRLMRGYISEKIFDCFQCGVIPLYWGAPNVADYIPPETFIWREDYKTTEDMLLYVKSMSADEINYKLDCIDKFLKSEKMSLFWEDTYVDKIISTIIC